MVAASSTKGYAVHRARLKRMMRIKDASLERLYQAGEVIRADAQASIRNGAISGAGHVPSRPGEPPNADTHNLDLGIDVRITNKAALRNSVSVVSTAPYSAALEFGHGALEARPFMRPALLRNRNVLVQGQVQAVHDVVQVFKTNAAFSAARASYEGA